MAFRHSLPNYLAATTAVQAIVGGPKRSAWSATRGSTSRWKAPTRFNRQGAVPVYFRLYGDPAIKKVADLKGKVLVATQAAASTDYAARMVLRRYAWCRTRMSKFFTPAARRRF